MIRSEAWIICYDEEYLLQMISGGSVYGGKCLSTVHVHVLFLDKLGKRNYIRVCSGKI